MGNMWLEKENYDSIHLIVNGAFLGWITDSMRAAFIATRVPNQLELIIFFGGEPSKLDQKIVEQEIIFYIEDSGFDYGINTVNYRAIILENDTIAGFKEKGGMWINEYSPVFQKYDFQSYDVED